MPRALWSGSISFGLVNIPIKMVSATKNVDVQFHQIHEKNQCRVRQKLYCPQTGNEVPRNELVKGYEIAPDQYVILSDKELDAAAPKTSRAIEITEFVDLVSIDPIYYDKPYYLLPEERAAKAYQLLVHAMLKAGKVAIAKFVMRNKEYLATLRPLGNVICLETMRFANEVVLADKLEGMPKPVPVDDRELKMAHQLIESLSENFEPEKYSDEYSKRLQDLIQKKIEGEEIVTEAPPTEAEGRVINLMAALEESLARAGKKKKEYRQPRKRQTKAS
jgi:DNA end-binding protein Ku